MPDQLPDLDTHQFSDRGLEALRLQAGSGLNDAYFLTDVLFDLLDGALAAVDDLTARVTALENPPT